jgi:hypothetical protein
MICPTTKAEYFSLAGWTADRRFARQALAVPSTADLRYFGSAFAPNLKMTQDLLVIFSSAARPVRT